MRKAGEVVGQWQGGVPGAARPLSANVQTEQFEALREGCDRPQVSSFDSAKCQFCREAHKAAEGICDFTFSAPKSVSIMASKSG